MILGLKFCKQKLLDLGDDLEFIACSNVSSLLYRAIKKDGHNFARLYFLNYISYVMIYIIFERGGSKVPNNTATALA
jgi:hypothetical protein